MSYSQYLSTSITNLAGLSAVAYGDSQYFYYVQNQFAYSREYRDLYRSRPSQLFFDFIIDIGQFEEYLYQFFETHTLINTNKKLKEKTLKGKTFEKLFLETFSLFLDINTIYDSSFIDILSKTFTDVFVYQKERGPDIAHDLNEFLINDKTFYSRINIFVEIITNNPTAKIYDVPDNHIITLLNSLDKIEFNSNGLNNNFVEIPIEQYENDYLYRGIKEARNSYVNLSPYVSANYSQYLPEHVSNPEEYNGIDTRIPLEAELNIHEIYGVPTTSDAVNRIKNFSLIGRSAGLTSL